MTEVTVTLSATEQKVVDAIEKLTVVEAANVAKYFEETYGISAAAAAPAAAGAPVEEEEKKGPQRRKSKKIETFCDRQLKSSGLTKKDITATVFVDDCRAWASDHGWDHTLQTHVTRRSPGLCPAP